MSHQIASDFVYDCQTCFKFKVRASNTKRTCAIIPSADKAKHFALFVYDMVFKPWEAFFPRWIKSSLALSALLNVIAFLFTGTFSFGRFPFLHGGASKFVKNRSIFTIASSARRSCDRFKCEAMCKASQHC